MVGQIDQYTCMFMFERSNQDNDISIYLVIKIRTSIPIPVLACHVQMGKWIERFILIRLNDILFYIQNLCMIFLNSSVM